MKLLRQVIVEILKEVHVNVGRDKVIDLLSRFKDNPSHKVHSELLKAFKTGLYDDLLKPPVKGSAFRGMGPMTTKKLTSMLGRSPSDGFQHLTTTVAAGRSWTTDPKTAVEYAVEASYGSGVDLKNTWSVIIIIDLSDNADLLFGNPLAIDRATGFSTMLPERELFSVGKPLTTSGIICVKNEGDYHMIKGALLRALRSR